MKRAMMFTAVTIFVLSCSITGVLAQEYTDKIEDSKQVVAAANFMMSQAQKLTAAKNIDRTWLVDDGHLLIKHGYGYQHAGEMMWEEEGSMEMKETGQKMLQAGQVLLKMGRQKGPLTQKENDEVKKQADMLNSFGKLMLDKGKTLGSSAVRAF